MVQLPYNPMPYLPGAIRQYLAADPDFVSLLKGGRISTREVPDPLTKPHVTVATVSSTGTDPMLRRLMVQVTPWAPSSEVSLIEEDPDVTVWNLAARAGELIGRAKNIVIDDFHAWSASWVDGPIQLWDKQRGADRVMYYAPVRFMVTLRRSAPLR